MGQYWQVKMLNKPAEYLIDFTEARWLEVPAEKANKLSHISKINGVFFQPNEKNEELLSERVPISDLRIILESLGLYLGALWASARNAMLNKPLCA